MNATVAPADLFVPTRNKSSSCIYNTIITRPILFFTYPWICFHLACLYDGIFHQHLKRNFDVRLQADRVILIPWKYLAIYQNNMKFPVDMKQDYPWILPREGILYIFVTNNDMNHPFNLTLLENNVMNKHSIIGIKVYKQSIEFRLRVS